MSDDLVKILDGNVFVVSDSRGDVEASLTDPTGLFSFDTRFLSQWVLTVNGAAPEPLVRWTTCSTSRRASSSSPARARSMSTPSSRSSAARSVGDGFHEELTILNHDDEARDLTVRIEAASDFADLFEVKDALEKKGRTPRASRATSSSSATSARPSRGRPDLRFEAGHA